VVLAAPLALASCAGSGSSDDDDTSDAGSSQDATGDYCQMLIGFSPTSPVAPATVYVDGSISREGAVSGVEAYAFSVTLAGVPQATQERDPFDGSKIQFDATVPGPYRVTLTGSVGYTSCTDGEEIINVVEPGANTDVYRLRFVPAPGQPAPAQERTVAIPGGAAYDLGAIALDSGVLASGVVRDADADPLPAYLRVALVGSAAQEVETFAGAAGSFSARLPAGSYDVLVVPEGSLVAPERFAGLALSSLGQLELDAGDAVSGIVLDPAGDPLVGARVSLRSGGVPSTIATTDGTGAFSVLARAGSATSVHVSPPDGSGLPGLDLPADAGLVAASDTPLTIRYAAGLTSRTVSLDVLASDQATPAAMARTTWIARPMSAAGTVTPEGNSALEAVGVARVSAVADGDGALSGVVLPETTYDLIVEPASALAADSPGLHTVNLSSGSSTPASVSLADAATLTGTVTRSGGVAVPGAQVTAVPRGALTNMAGASATATTSEEGAFALALVGTGEYDLVIEPPGSSLARARVEGVTAPSAGGSAAIEPTGLTAAIAVTGSVTIPGVAGGATGVHVMLLCHDCTGMAAHLPVADAVADRSGRFALAVPDPGITTARRLARARAAATLRPNRRRK